MPISFCPIHHLLLPSSHFVQIIVNTYSISMLQVDGKNTSKITVLKFKDIVKILKLYKYKKCQLILSYNLIFDLDT